MVWCLHEALLQSEQNALRSSVTISLARDARRSRLMVRFGSCSNLFKIRVGLLGVERGGGDRAGQIVESTRAIITRFCSKWAKPPRWFNGPEPFFDKELFQMVCDKVEIVMSDAAANELLAGQVSRGRRDTRLEADNVEVLTPNLLLVGRDKAHAFRKVLQRPYLADGFLNTVMENHILSSDSMVQKISASWDFREWLESEIQQGETKEWGKKVSNLKAAKHRFESHSTPLGRLLLYLPAFVATTTRIAETREDKVAIAYLEGLSAEEILQLAMVADAADEALVLIRSVDQEDVDLSMVSTFVHSFMVRIATLFMEEKVMQVGYTMHVMDLTTTGGLTMFLKRSGQAKRIAAPDRECRQRCLDRMKCWAKLAAEVVETEFPNYSVFNAFGRFQLKSMVGGDSAAVEMQAVQRLSQVFKVNPGGLKDQLERHRPLAEKFQRDMSCSNKEAWLTTMARTSSMRQGQSSYPFDHLGPVIWRYLSWQACALRVCCQLLLDFFY
ncbi:Uncharacterized protein SCF082_LOCUS45530 [Durusdinium trenchii]|uniref:Uncharacterized protein n=1 Tax=Durusdinium trenchii TaxID=1381693 RepID=A0ABP0RD11_9DINO